MPTYFPFRPTAQAAFTFQPVLDGNTYQAIVTWALFGQRYYLNLFSLDNVPVFSRPVVATLPSVDLQTLSFSVDTMRATAVTASEHGFRIGETVSLTIIGCDPAGYNGVVPALVTNATEFTYPLTAAPGDIVTPGQVGYYISMTAGYFTSALIYRNGSFEVSP